MTTKTFNISGMTCGGCTASVQKALQAVDGVQSISVSLENQQAVISFDEAIVSVQALSETIEDAGFDVSAVN
ncbi:heavy-metal-associated domain-containing protein [uncultured Moraxella sp.]|uniref:heavy-metal-associated domain-containing protein n=1 Tax=uncultured Moraxella sp. TaxID=263769 RepID=UPI0025D80B57|nr:heavy-metal-associated domain-containing protein [uncultured Moraxella sp.]